LEPCSAVPRPTSLDNSCCLILYAILMSEFLEDSMIYLCNSGPMLCIVVIEELRLYSCPSLVVGWSNGLCYGYPLLSFWHFSGSSFWDKISDSCFMVRLLGNQVKGRHVVFHWYHGGRIVKFVVQVFSSFLLYYLYFFLSRVVLARNLCISCAVVRELAIEQWAWSVFHCAWVHLMILFFFLFLSTGSCSARPVATTYLRRRATVLSKSWTAVSIWFQFL
jgi:hypothetical protein